MKGSIDEHKLRNFLDHNGGWTNVFGRPLFITEGEVNSEKYSQLSELVNVVDGHYSNRRDI